MLVAPLFQKNTGNDMAPIPPRHRLRLGVAMLARMEYKTTTTMALVMAMAVMMTMLDALTCVQAR